MPPLSQIAPAPSVKLPEGTVVVPCVVRCPLIVPPAKVKLLNEVVPFALSVPPLMTSELTVAAESKPKLPTEILTIPDVPPFNSPFNAALPPETVSVPSSVVSPNTVNEPPEMARELALPMVNPPMVSAPVV